MNTKRHTLPARLSTLLRVAVEDAKKIQRTPGYKCDRSTMGMWHDPQYDLDATSLQTVPCGTAVCLAGAVMVRRLGAAKDRSLVPRQFSQSGAEKPGVPEKLRAINEMRTGHFTNAWQEISRIYPVPPKVRAALVKARKAYGRQKVLAPWRTYLKCARILKRAGL